MHKPSVHTIVIRDARSGERGLLVEIHENGAEPSPSSSRVPSETDVRTFEERLFNAGIRVGLYVTPTKLLVIRDSLTAMEFESNRFELTSLETRSLLDRAGKSITRSRELHDQVLSFLKILPDIWMHALPREAIKAMAPDVIGHLFEAEFEMFDGTFSDIAASA